MTTDQFFHSPVTFTICMVRAALQTQSHSPGFYYHCYAALGEDRLADATFAKQSQMLSGNGILQHVDLQALVYPNTVSKAIIKEESLKNPLPTV